MGRTTLTISLDNEVKEKAISYFKTKGGTISKFIENKLRKLLEEEEDLYGGDFC